MVRVCENCSGVDTDKLAAIVPTGQLTIECIGECGQHQGSSFGFINDELVIKDTEEEFFDTVKASL